MSARPERTRERGQSLVEFSMIVPLFLLFLLGVLEFGFAFDHELTISYATREGARTGAALANGDDLVNCNEVDRYVVAAVERVLDSPGSPIKGHLADVTRIRIFKANSTGGEAGPGTTWEPGTGPTVDGKSLSFYHTTGTWDPCTRQNWWNGTGSPPDSIGVSISYTYHAVTPLAAVLQVLGGNGWSTLAMGDRSIMALNPTD